MANTNLTGSTLFERSDGLTEANLGDWIVRSNSTQYVEKGLGFTYDATNVDVTVGTGTAIVRDSANVRDYTITVSSSLNVSLTDGTVNHLFIATTVDATTSTVEDEQYLHVDTDDTPPSDPNVKLGTVDTSVDTTTELNRSPSGSFRSLTMSGNVDFGGNIANNVKNVVGDGSTNLSLYTEGNNLAVNSGGNRILTGFSTGNVSVPNGNFDAGGQLRLNVNGNIESLSAGNTLNFYDSKNLKQMALVEGGDMYVPNGSITQGKNPSDTISESTSPKGFDFSGDDGRDLHDKTDVTISNGTTASATETITVELYDGTDTTGTLLTSESISVSVASGGSKTVTFITGDVSLDNGTYHVNVTQSGTTFSIDQTDEYTKGATYSFGQTNTGDLYVRDQDGTDHLKVGSTGPVEVKNAHLNLNANNILDSNRITGQNGGGLYLAADTNSDKQVLLTTGTGSGYFSIRDGNSNNNLFVANEGGPVEVLNTTLHANLVAHAGTNSDATFVDAWNGELEFNGGGGTSNGVTLRNDSGELYGIDSAGNSTTLT